MSRDEGFLSRWARRKALARAGVPLPPEPSVRPDAPGMTDPQAPPAAEGTLRPTAAPPLDAKVGDHGTPVAERWQATPPSGGVALDGGALPSPADGDRPPAQAPAASATPAAAVPTLEDVARLTPQSDFSRFVQPQVPTPVRNAALRKLFADPHFNVMDGLDVYIDDYSRPDPLPAAMARKMVAAQFMRLFDEPKTSASPAPADAGVPGPAPVAPAAYAAPVASSLEPSLPMAAPSAVDGELEPVSTAASATGQPLPLSVAPSATNAADPDTNRYAASSAS